MDEQRDALSEANAGYISVGEAACILGVSERSVYSYAQDGRLAGERRASGKMVLRVEEVRSLERRSPGRLRANSPRWHVPPLNNEMYLTTITVRARPGQGALLDERLVEMRRADAHRVSGTMARYIGRNQADPDEIEMILVWRCAVMPPAEEREAAVAALMADLAEVLDWETVGYTYGRVLLHA